MMETPHLRKSEDRAQIGRLNRPGLRRIFGQPQVSLATVIIIKVAFEDGSEMPFSKNDHRVQAVSPHRSDQPLHVGPLPGAGRSGEDLLNAQASDSLAVSSGKASTMCCPVHKAVGCSVTLK
jgi:hypothetical protein